MHRKASQFSPAVVYMVKTTIPLASYRGISYTSATDIPFSKIHMYSHKITRTISPNIGTFSTTTFTYIYADNVKTQATGAINLHIYQALSYPVGVSSQNTCFLMIATT